MRVLLSAGGTAGHIYPAIAIAEILRTHHPDCEIAFVGTPAGMENRLVAEAGYPLHHVRVAGLQRRVSFANVKAGVLFFTSQKQARRLLHAYRPDLVVGTGGYVCYPLLRTAARLGVPCAVHESNALPGLSVKMLSRHVDAVLVNYPVTAKYLPHARRVVRVGNPTRASFEGYTRTAARQKLQLGSGDFLVLSFGGSLGAEAINQACVDMMLREKSDSALRFVHSTGRTHYEQWQAVFAAAPRHCRQKHRLLPYISDMPLYMQAADVVICRAGAMTLSELCAVGRAAILVPSPHVTNNHQYENAAVLWRAGACELLEEKDLSAEALRACVERLRTNRTLRQNMEAAMRASGVQGANEKLYAALRPLLPATL
ncbi:MAG: undecaprenyldiphospho-muramoylpentapeptide beta-N-acetylglucosaminyltransferase [Eubacteriales bacterium]